MNRQISIQELLSVSKMWLHYTEILVNNWSNSNAKSAQLVFKNVVIFLYENSSKMCRLHRWSYRKAYDFLKSDQMKLREAAGN